MGFFTSEYMTDGSYDSSLSQSAQGQLSSEYTNALSSHLQSEAVADYIAFLAHTVNGLSVEDALALKASVIAGEFDLSGLFGAAQSKSGAVDGSDITDPTPALTVGDVTIDLTTILTGLDTETWETVTGKNTISHTREFYTDTQEPADYDANWANPTAHETVVLDTIVMGDDDNEGSKDQHAFGSLELKGDLDGTVTVTVSGLGDYNWENENVNITIEGVGTVELPLSGQTTGNPNLDNTESLTFVLNAQILGGSDVNDDGFIDWDVSFNTGGANDGVADGSTVTLTFDYDYFV